MTLINSILLLLPGALQAWLIAIFRRKRLEKEFPFFYAYNVIAVAALFLRFLAQPSYQLYFATYWITEAAYAVLGLLATFELFPHVFRTFSRVRRFWVVVWIVVLLMIALAALHAIFKGAVQAGPVVATIASLEIAAGYVQAGVFLVMVAMSAFYWMPLRRYAFGIAFGFGLLAADRLAAALLRSEFGTRFKFLFTNMPPVIYVIAVVIWLVTFSRPEPPDPFGQIQSPLSPEQMIERIRRITKALKGERDDINLLDSISSPASGTGESSFHAAARDAAPDDHRSPEIPAQD
jgi:hypothetical protein